MKNNKLHELLTLIYRCSLAFIFICISASILGAALVFFKHGYLNIDWKETIFLSIKKGVVIGLALGIGLWIKARLQERKDKKTLSK